MQKGISYAWSGPWVEQAPSNAEATVLLYEVEILPDRIIPRANNLANETWAQNDALCCLFVCHVNQSVVAWAVRSNKEYTNLPTYLPHILY